MMAYQKREDRRNIVIVGGGINVRHGVSRPPPNPKTLNN